MDLADQMEEYAESLKKKLAVLEGKEDDKETGGEEEEGEEEGEEDNGERDGQAETRHKKRSAVN